MSSVTLISFISASEANSDSRQLLHQLLLMYLGVMTVVTLLALYWAKSSELRRHHEQCIVESESRLRRLSTKLLAAQEAERRNLSRDLHDELGQQATAISLDLRSMQRAQDETQSNSLLRRAIDETDNLLKSLHEIARRVRPRVLDDLGLHDAVESLLAEFQERTGVQVAFQLHFCRERIPPAVGENVFRILQEALSNVATHAQVDEAEVILETDNDSLRLTVRDLGIGFEPQEQTESTRLGLLGMRERVELLDGQFDLESAPSEGTQIRVAIPLPGDQQ